MVKKNTLSYLISYVKNSFVHVVHKNTVNQILDIYMTHIEKKKNKIMISSDKFMYLVFAIAVESKIKNKSTNSFWLFSL